MGKELHLLRIDVVDGENIDHGRWDDAFVDIGYEGGRRRTKLARVQKGRAMFLSPIEFGMSTPPTCMMAVRVILDSPVLGTKERCKTAVSLDDVVVSGTKHNLRVVVDPVKRTTLNLTVWVAKPGEKDPPMAIAQPRRTGGNFTITVGTQTVESRVHGVAVPRSTFASFPTGEEEPLEGHGPDVGSPSLKPTLDAPGLTVRPEYASTLDHASGVAMDIELVKRLAAAWPVDQVEGLLVYCQRLKEEKADLEKAALRQTMLSARTATSELRRRPSPPKQRGGPFLGAGAASRPGVREAGEPRLLEPAFPAAASSDAEETFAKLALVHGQPLSNAEREHVSRHYDTL